MGQLPLKDLYIGKTDGYNEFLEYGQSVCKELFFEYPNFDLQKILNGSIYYICGDKGTGKTMLLKYVEAVVSEKPESMFSEFIRFRKDVDEDQRNQIKRSGLPQTPFEEVIESEIPGDATINCVLAWQVYLIKVIINRLKHTEYGVFDRDSAEWENLCALLDAIYDDPQNANPIKKILPRIKKENVELNVAKLGKVNLELEWTDEAKKTVPFSELGKRVIDLYSKLQPVPHTLYIFVDELELSLKQTKKYERDITLIRDLIFAIQYLNEISKENGFNVYAITAIRNEVYKEVKSKGLEINKPIHDFGIQISWQQKGGAIRENPLLKMLVRRFQCSEKICGLDPTPDVFDAYFLKSVGRSGIAIENYILDQTWLRPRDIIRLFSIMQKVAGDKTFIDQKTFEIVRQQYSEESWSEFEEILTVKYSDVEVEGIKLALTGLQVPFSTRDFAERIDGKADIFEEVEYLKTKGRKPGQILRDLYDIGVIGNYGNGTPRFSFKGDKDIDPMLPLTFHYPLLRFFKASIKSYDKRLSEYN